MTMRELQRASSKIRYLPPAQGAMKVTPTRMLREWLCSSRVVLAGLAIAWLAICVVAWLPTVARAAEDFLPPEQAFRFSASMNDASTISVRFEIADSYYLYRDKLQFAAEGATLGTPQVPKGKVKFDPNFEKNVETFHRQLVVVVPVQASSPFTLKVTSQGCSEKGLCYPPMSSEVRLLPPAAGKPALTAASPMQGTRSVVDADPTAAEPSGTANADGRSEGDMGRIEAALASGKLLVIVPLFLLLGLGLSFTPCVLPMVPILSFIIAGEGAHTSRSRGFVLALAYSLGMALVYTALGIAAGLVGEGLSAALQSPPILATFGILMALMALSMFDVYQLQMPASLQLALTRLSERQRAGKLAGVFVMGAISALIVGPCVAAPLAGALVYISQTRDVLVGGSALFAMAAGMSLPLLLVGLSAGALLPRAGHWMQAVKAFFGVLMLALALWMVAPLIPAWLLMLGWGLLGTGYGASLLVAGSQRWKARVVGAAFIMLGAVQLVGVATGGREPWAPLAHLGGAPVAKTPFMRIKSNADLERAIASANGRIVMLDFYADWCVACIEMEKLTFSDPAVRAELDRMLLLQADVTANDADDKALLKRFGLFGPPGILFFGASGDEMRSARVIGYQKPEVFLQSLARTRQP
jgi:thiol:disulfide interchange protein DsbD